MLAYNATFDVLLNAVNSIREELNIKMADYPIDIWEIVERYPYLKIVEESFITDGLCGFLIRNKKPDPSIIVINSHINNQDKNFAICHEIIHYFCHPIEHEDKIFSAYNKKYIQSPQEQQANEGAAELLVPHNLFIKDMENALKFYNDNSTAIINTAKIYNVNPEVISRKLKYITI